MSAKANDQSVTDDQELAKVLANNANQQKQQTAAAADDALQGLQFEESPVPSQGGGQTAPATASGQNTPAQTTTATTPAITPSPSASAAAATKNAPSPSTSTTATPSAQTTATSASSATTPSTAAGGALENIKKDALEELRPLVDKLDLPPEEKFDTLLLIIRSTDDQSLLEPAHDAAKAIVDEARRAQALLDVIKEIDYFSSQSTT